MTSASDKFAELETRIIRTIELVKTTRQEKDKAEKELAGARAARLHVSSTNLKQLRRERDLVKNKVESCWKICRSLTEETLV